MVKLAIQNLTKSELEELTDPIKCKSFGYILDPSCGAGSFLVEIIHQLLPKVIENLAMMEQFYGLRIWVIMFFVALIKAIEC
ncbi:MAG: hypothetical protein IPK31_03015 [Chitinophagaceae bacterium]|nr:hypothetical protein [Chitinophagaceae bacterium]